jgi:alkanesulfonate monooxygenase SsuD/methylene tetrahydromethanopterin reductase-like flavin-dependent oxidoreductase (luciferase family)
MARLAANLDHLSGGRFIFGVGAGWAEQEFAALGVPFRQRGRITDESIEAMKALWATDDQVSYKGETVSFSGVSGMRPKQSPHPPIWVGGNTEAAMRRAVRHSDGWHPINFTRPWIRQHAARLKRLAEKSRKPSPALCPRIQLKLTERDVSGDERVMGIGSLEQMRGDLALLQELGSRHVTLDWYISPDLEATTHHERGWQMLATLADKALNLAKETVR